MRWLATIIEWLLLLPLWRRIFKPRMLQGFFAGATALVWLIIIIGIAASAGGGGGEKPESATRAQASPTVAGGGQAQVSATAGAPGEKQETPEAPSPERIVSGTPGAIAEAEGVRVTLNATADPWVSDNQFIRPDAGKRFVAFDVTIQNSKDSGTHGANPFNFKLSDAEDFAYEVTFGGPEPAVHAVDLGSGEKTRGWVAFEVNAGTPLKRLKYDPNPFTTNDIEFQFQ